MARRFLAPRLFALLPPLALAAACSAEPGAGPEGDAPATAAPADPLLATEVVAYLSGGLDTLEAVTLGRDTLPWSAIRDSALLFAYGAEETSDTYAALSWALGRVNEHSFLQAERPGAVAETLPGGIGYIHVPQRGGQGQALADSLHAAVADLRESGVCGWIVDLRANGGGNMWPMIAGVGPLLGDSVLGSFGDDVTEQWFYRQGASGIRRNGELEVVSEVTVPVVPMISVTSPVAVMFDEGTGSSGEAVAVAFQGRPNSRSFGSPTAGRATSNRGSRLPDGANMVVTTGYYTDRVGRTMGVRLEPDTPVPALSTDWPYATDRVAAAATEWLSAHPGCAAQQH